MRMWEFYNINISNILIHGTYYSSTNSFSFCFPAKSQLEPSWVISDKGGDAEIFKEAL